MPITVIVRSEGGEDARLTFDGTQRIVIGRSSGSDVRLPERSVSHRHASLRASGADFFLVDEGSTNGTFVGAERVPPHTSRLVRSGDQVRIGRLWLVLVVDQTPITRDVAAATRDLALALVTRALALGGADRNPSVRVVEGADAGSVLSLDEAGNDYVVGRAPHCDLPLADPDVSRDHTVIVRRDAAVFVRDLGAKNGTWMGGMRLGADETPWRATLQLRLGRTALALDEPLGLALTELESAPDEFLSETPAPPSLPAPAPPPGAPAPGPAASAPVVSAGTDRASKEPSRRRIARSRWTVVDFAVMGASLAILVASLAGLVWLLRR